MTEGSREVRLASFVDDLQQQAMVENEHCALLAANTPHAAIDDHLGRASRLRES